MLSFLSIDFPLLLSNASFLHDSDRFIWIKVQNASYPSIFSLYVPVLITSFLLQATLLRGVVCSRRSTAFLPAFDEKRMHGMLSEVEQ